MPARWWLTALCCLPLLANAGEKKSSSDAGSPRNDSAPDLALLEFLGSFDTEDASWLENELENVLEDENDATQPATIHRSGTDSNSNARFGTSVEDADHE